MIIWNLESLPNLLVFWESSMYCPCQMPAFLVSFDECLGGFNRKACILDFSVPLHNIILGMFLKRTIKRMFKILPFKQICHSPSWFSHTQKKLTHISRGNYQIYIFIENQHTSRWYHNLIFMKCQFSINIENQQL